MKKLKSHPLIKGTIILTVTGLISRIIGFFYRIYLARLFGEEGMGIYQLLGPVTSLSFALAAAGYQTAISKLVAESTVKNREASFRPMIAGLSISLPLSLMCNTVIYRFSNFLAANFLLEPRTAPMLRIISFTVPLSAVHACINGYFYGVKKTGIPSATQLLEQCLRVGCVYWFSMLATAKGASLTINVAVLGLVIGEIGSTALSLISIYYLFGEKYMSQKHSSQGLMPFSPVSSSGKIQKATAGIVSLYRPLLAMALPLTANRIVLNLLQSVESVSIPEKLRLYGYDSSTALSVYGVLTGMAMPLIFFPNALTSAVSVLLLPMISESYARGDYHAVKKNTSRTIKYCVLLGLSCMSGFFLLGGWAGENLFHSALAGHFIRTLSLICPFIYLDTTLSSILQGLGMAGRIFFMNVFSLLIRLGFVFFAVPRFGITGYLWGILASQTVLSLLYLGSLYLAGRKL